MGKKRSREAAAKAEVDEEVVEFVQGQRPAFGQRLVHNGMCAPACAQIEAERRQQCSKHTVP
eukprot:3806338-Prymnesium_polylepis.2